MNLRIRHVLPTAPSPTRQTLTFIFWRSIRIPRAGASLAHVSGYKGVAHRLSIEIMAGGRRGCASMASLVSPGPPPIGEGGGSPRPPRPRLCPRAGLRGGVGPPPPARIL